VCDWNRINKLNGGDMKTEKGEYRMSGFGQAKGSEYTKPGEVESIRIEPGQNGFSVQVRKKHKPVRLDSKGHRIEAGMSEYQEPKPKFYSDVAGVLGCIKEELG